MNKFETITTPRLTLRKLTPEVFTHVFEALTESEQMHFFGLSTTEALNEQRDRFEKGMSTFNKSLLYFQVIDTASDTVIGWCGFHTWYVPHRRAEIGYELVAEHYKKQGIMSEAIAPVIAYGFQQMNLNRIEAFVSPINLPSLRIVKKQGFTKEGLLRQHYCKNGVLEDSVVFSLLKSEYDEL